MLYTTLYNYSLGTSETLILWVCDDSISTHRLFKSSYYYTSSFNYYTSSFLRCVFLLLVLNVILNVQIFSLVRILTNTYFITISTFLSSVLVNFIYN